MKHTFNLILFDLDGTLLDTAEDFLTAVNQLLHHHHLSNISKEQLAPYISEGSRGIVLHLFPQIANDSNPNRLYETQQHLLSLYNEVNGQKTRLFPYMQEVLLLISQLNMSWGIVTNKPSLYALPLLKRLQIIPDTCICSDQVEFPKPNPEGLLLACRQLGHHPNDSIYIGDNPVDIHAANDAGIYAIAAEYGYIANSPSITTWGADHIISSPQELLPIIEQTKQAHAY